MQRGERIVGDLRPRGRHGGEEGRLAGVGQADQPGIGDQLQPQPDPALLARPALVGAARRAVGRGLVVRVAEAAVAAAQQHHALAGRVEVGEQRLAVLGEDLRADRHLDHHVRRARAGAVGARRRCRPSSRGNAACSGSRSACSGSSTASNTMSPPLPPSPPSGPPNSMNFSRRNATTPSPPSPERQIDLGLVEEFHGARIQRKRGPAGADPRSIRNRDRRLIRRQPAAVRRRRARGRPTGA